MRFVLALGLLSVLTAYSEAAPRCHMNELWSCVEIAIDWVHSLPPRQIPETEDDVEVMCDEIDKTMNCLFGYRDNCTTPLQKELISLTVEGAIELSKDFCTPGSSSRTKYLAHSVCLNKISQMDVVKEQLEYILAVLEKAHKVSEQEFLTYACCGYSKITNTFIKLGQDNCGQEAVDAARDLISLAIAQLPEVICGGYSGEEDVCKSILPPEGTKAAEEYKGTEIYKLIRNVLKNWLD